jgi:hypothetical protein
MPHHGKKYLSTESGNALPAVISRNTHRPCNLPTVPLLEQFKS